MNTSNKEAHKLVEYILSTFTKTEVEVSIEVEQFATTYFNFVTNIGEITEENIPKIKYRDIILKPDESVMFQTEDCRLNISFNIWQDEIYVNIFPTYECKQPTAKVYSFREIHRIDTENKTYLVSKSAQTTSINEHMLDYLPAYEENLVLQLLRNLVKNSIDKHTGKTK